MNDKNYLTDNIQSLNPDLREAIGKVNYLNALHKIQQDRRLHIDQAAALEKLTFMLMLGEINELQYLSKLENELGVSTSEAEDIGGEVQGTILEPIIQEFQRIEHGSVSNQKSGEETPVAAVPVAPIATSIASATPSVPLAQTQPIYHPSDTLRNIPAAETAPANPAVSLTREDILADIEDAAAVHTSALGENLSLQPQTLKSLDMSTAKALTDSVQPVQSIPTAIKPMDIAVAPKEIVPTAPTPVSVSTPPVVEPTLQKPIAPTIVTPPQISSALSTNMETPVTNKPTKVTTTIDPYLEAI